MNFLGAEWGTPVSQGASECVLPCPDLLAFPLFPIALPSSAPKALRIKEASGKCLRRTEVWKLDSVEIN